MKTLTAAIFLIFLATTANASYLTNGDFELSPADNGIVNDKSWSELGWDVWHTLPGWTTSLGPGIEVQRSGVVTTAQSGDYYIELDSHGGNDTNSTMFQNVYLTEGNYALSFWYFARTNTENDNGIFARIINPGSTFPYIAETSIDKTNWSMGNTWEEISMTFHIETADDYHITFGALEGSIDNSFGGFIDNVSLVHMPEPSTMMLLGFGLLGLSGMIRRRNGSSKKTFWCLKQINRVRS